MSARLINFLKSVAVYGVGAGVVSTVYVLAVAAARPDGERSEYYPALNPAEFNRLVRQGQRPGDAGLATAPIAALPQDR